MRKQARTEDPFESALAATVRDQIARTGNSVFGISPDLRLAWFNDGWYRFARDNDGEPAISQQWNIGQPLLASVPDCLHDFIQAGFERCAASGRPWEYSYECSSPGQWRQFRQTVYPLGPTGFLVVNALQQASPYALDPESATMPLDQYLNADGFVEQCANCRKLLHQQGQHWDWLPSLVDTPYPRTSHTICPPCASYYYRDLLG